MLNTLGALLIDNIVEAPSATLANADVQTYTIPSYPKPYFRGANGGIYMRSVSVDGEVEERSIYHNDLYVVERVKDAEEGESIVMRLHLPKDGVQKIGLGNLSMSHNQDREKMTVNL